MTDPRSASDRADSFRAMHRKGDPLLLPNPWDAGSARILASLGFAALATTSSGFAATLGRPDGSVTREESMAHAVVMVAATDLPVSADLENGFADQPADVADTVAEAVRIGLAGCSIEDFTGRADTPIYGQELATERIAAAAQAARSGPVQLVLTARAENYLHGRADLKDTIERLQHYQEAGADVLYAPGVTRREDVKALVSSVDLPVNVLALPGGPGIPELAELGVSRVSVGGAFAYVAIDALAAAARELREAGTLGYWARAASGRDIAASAFHP